MFSSKEAKTMKEAFLGGHTWKLKYTEKQYIKLAYANFNGMAINEEVVKIMNGAKEELSKQEYEQAKKDWYKE